MDDYTWVDDAGLVDLEELSHLYLIAPLGHKEPAALGTAFANSMFCCFAYAGRTLAGAGRALADGVDTAYLADVAVHPGYQGQGLGREIVRRLVDAAHGHQKIILYTLPGNEAFYAKLGFMRMTTAMGLWQDRSGAVARGLLVPGP